MRNPVFLLGENKGADQLRGNRTADQGLCFCHIDNTIPLLPKSKISNWGCTALFVSDLSETLKTGFVSSLLKSSVHRHPM